MSPHPTNKPAAAKGHSLRYYAWLALQLATRDIAVRYRGTSLGWLWALFTPLLMLGVYTFAFKYIFKVRWPGVGDSPVDFALQLFAGLLIFQAAADCWGRSSRIIAEQPHLVKKVVFPLALLPWAPVLNAVFHAGVSMLLLLVVAIRFRIWRCRRSFTVSSSVSPSTPKFIDRLSSVPSRFPSRFASLCLWS